MLTVSNLRKTYGPRVAVDDVSFELKQGETFGLLGPNGAGKSTTIHMLCGVLTPDAGEIRIDGQADPTQPGVRARLGVAPQSLSLYDDLSAEENLKFFGRCYRLPTATLKQRVDWCLTFAG